MQLSYYIITAKCFIRYLKERTECFLTERISAPLSKAHLYNFNTCTWKDGLSSFLLQPYFLQFCNNQITCLSDTLWIHMEFPFLPAFHLIHLCLWKTRWMLFSLIINRDNIRITNNYPPKGRWIAVDIYRDAKCWGIYPPLLTDPEGNSSFSIYQIRWIKKCCFNFFFWNFCKTTRHFSLHSQNSEYPRIFRVTGANQSAW